MTETVRVLALIGGVVLIVAMLSDAVATLIVTQGQSGLWRPTRLFYAATWRGTRALAARLPDRTGEYVLNVYPALSLLGLLVLWLAGLMFGWSLVYWGVNQPVAGARDWGALVYYAGTSLVTPVFGSAHGAVIRTLTLLETLTGVVTIALMISYLPALYGAYSRRESRLLTLDDPRGGRITPVRVIVLERAGGRRRAAVPLLRRVAAVDRRRAGEPRVVPDARAVPLAARGPVVGHRARRGHRRSDADVGVRRRARGTGSRTWRTGAGAAPSWRSRAACTSRRPRCPPRGSSSRTSSWPGSSWSSSASRSATRRGVGRPPGAARRLRRPARAPDRLPRRAPRLLGALRRGDGGRRGGAGRRRGPPQCPRPPRTPPRTPPLTPEPAPAEDRARSRGTRRYSPGLTWARPDRTCTDCRRTSSPAAASLSADASACGPAPGDWPHRPSGPSPRCSGWRAPPSSREVGERGDLRTGGRLDPRPRWPGSRAPTWTSRFPPAPTPRRSGRPTSP